MVRNFKQNEIQNLLFNIDIKKYIYMLLVSNTFIFKTLMSILFLHEIKQKSLEYGHVFRDENYKIKEIEFFIITGYIIYDGKKFQAK